MEGLGKGRIPHRIGDDQLKSAWVVLKKDQRNTMAQLDTYFALKLFMKQTGRIPTGRELDYIKQLIITVPITTIYENSLNFREEEIAIIRNQAISLEVLK
jgi:hypothetical protein